MSKAKTSPGRSHFSSDELEAALDLLEVLEVGWHDCYGEVTPSEEIVDDVILLANGGLAGLIGSVRLALADWRDVQVAAAAVREAR